MLKGTKKVDTNRYQLEITIDGEKFGEAIEKAYRQNKLQLEGVEEIREIALRNLEEGFIESLRYCIENVKERGKEVHPQSEEALKVAISVQNN